MRDEPSGDGRLARPAKRSEAVFLPEAVSYVPLRPTFIALNVISSAKLPLSRFQSKNKVA